MPEFSQNGEGNGAQRRSKPHTGRARADQALAFHLAQGRTVKESARLAGVSRRLAFVRLKDTEFVEKVAAARADLYRRGRGQLAANLSYGLARLRELAGSDNEQIALRAAVALAKLAMPGKLAATLGTEDIVRAQPLLQHGAIERVEDTHHAPDDP